MKYKRITLTYAERESGTLSEPVFRINCPIPNGVPAHVALESCFLAAGHAGSTNESYVKIAIKNSTVSNAIVTADGNYIQDNCLGRVGFLYKDTGDNYYVLNTQYESMARLSEEATNLLELPNQTFRLGQIALKITQGDSDTGIVSTGTAARDNYAITLGIYYDYEG